MMNSVIDLLLIGGALAALIALSKVLVWYYRDPPNDYFAPTVVLIGLICVAPSVAETVLVERVEDGDTIVTSAGRYDLYGIDAPEQRQLGGGDATIWLHRRIGNRFIELEKIEGKAELILEDGVNVGKEMVAMGIAWATPDGPYVSLQQDAATKRRGLWARVLTPNAWREKNSRATSAATPVEQKVDPNNPTIVTPARQVRRKVRMFWTEGCAPCARLKPEFAKLKAELTSQGYEFSDTGRVADAFHAGIRPPYPWIVVYDASGRELRRLQGYASMPSLRRWVTGESRARQRIIYQPRINIVPQLSP